MPSAELTAVQRRQAIDEMNAALGELSGVKSAAAVMRLPLRGGGDSFGVTIQRRPDMKKTPAMYSRIVARRLLRDHGIRSDDGRTFNTSDRLDGGEMPSS